MNPSRTPIVKAIPFFLRLAADLPKRTPLINGTIARSITELLKQPEMNLEPLELESSLKLNEMDPESEEIWAQTHEYMLKTSLAYFFTETIRGPAESPYFGKSLAGMHHVEWDDVVNNHDRFLILAARDHGKSHYFSIAYPIWRAAYTHVGKLGIVFSASQDLANDFLYKIKCEIEDNPKLQHLLPFQRDTKKELILVNGSAIRARGMKTRVRGGHPYWIIVDDGLSDDDIYSETIRKRTIDYFLSAITNMIVPGGQLGVVGTPMHMADLYAHLRSTGVYFYKEYPAIKNGKILFPERYDRARLELRKKELKSAARFAREFLVQPLTDEASLFPSTLFAGSDIRLPYCLGQPASYWEELGMPRYTGIDFAMSASVGADYTVIITVAVDAQGVRWIANIRRGLGLAFQTQLDLIKEEYAYMRPDMMHAEANQMQRIFSDEIIRETDIPIRKFFTSGRQPKNPSQKTMGQLTVNKHHIDRGVPSLRMTLENKKWRIPRGDENSIELTDLWMGELQAMSWQDGQVLSVGDHDDLVMATWMADTAIRIGGFSFSFDSPEKENLADPPDSQYSREQEKEEEDWRPKEGAPLPAHLGLSNFGF